MSTLKENLAHMLVPKPQKLTLNTKKMQNFTPFFHLKHEFFLQKKHPFFLEIESENTVLLAYLFSMKNTVIDFRNQNIFPIVKGTILLFQSAIFKCKYLSN